MTELIPDMRVPPAALTVAGSDSGGGAGIQADLKTFAAHGVYGTSAITAVTAQNTVGVAEIQVIDPDIVAAQIDAILVDIEIAAVKTGMLANAATVRSVVAALQSCPDIPVVVDPVTHAKRGDPLIDADGFAAIRDVLLPRCSVVTPNLAEASALTGIPIHDDDDMVRAGRCLLALGAAAAVVKGGHRTGDANDLFIDGTGITWLRGARIETSCTHGTGCTFSAAITAQLALGCDLLEAVERAKAYLTDALRAAYRIGAGNSPVNHMFALGRSDVRTKEGVLG